MGDFTHHGGRGDDGCEHPSYGLLEEHLSSQRSNGLRSMVARICEVAAAA
jgi:hypothetical protein